MIGRQTGILFVAFVSIGWMSSGCGDEERTAIPIPPTQTRTVTVPAATTPTAATGPTGPTSPGVVPPENPDTTGGTPAQPTPQPTPGDTGGASPDEPADSGGAEAPEE